MKIKKGERIQDLHLVDETILLGDEGVRAIVNCTLERCHVVVDRRDHIIAIGNSKFIQCTLDFKRKLKNARLVSCDYVQCTFRGNFDGVDFGRWPVPDPLTKQMDELGNVVDCDFTQATLDMCRFFSVDIARQKFGPWPQFVVPYAQELAASKLDRVWPGKFSRYHFLIQDEDPTLTASTGTREDFMKRYAITEEELLKVLDDIGCVIK